MAESGITRRPLSRRDFISAAAGAGFAVVAGSTGWLGGYAYAAGVPGGPSSIGTGTAPEQIHLTWGADAAHAVTISWLSPQPQARPEVIMSPAVDSNHVFPATHYTYTDGLSGEVVHAYHVSFDRLLANTQYVYTIRDDETPTVTFTSRFTTANTGRFAFAFTCFGDLGTPGAGATYTLADGTVLNSSTYSESQWNAYTAVSEVENLNPLFHLLNGDLSYADKATIAGGTIPAVQTAPEVWRDFGLNTQRSAANRPWMPCIGNHEAELDNGPYGYASYNTRYKLPDNGSPQFRNSYYTFRVGSVVFISLDANDVCYQGGGAFNVAGVPVTDSRGYPISATAAQYNQFYTGTFTTNSDGTWSPGGPNPNQQTLWLQSTLQAARADYSVDWIIVQMHQSAMSNSSDNGCDAAIRQAWLPLFDKYQVDLVVNGHDHDYSRTYPVRGFTPNLGTGVWPGGAVTQAPAPGVFEITTANNVTVPSNIGTVNTFTPNVISPQPPLLGPFDTSKGTVYLVLGGGGTNKRDNTYVAGGRANVTTFTQIRTGQTKPTADATEPAAWAAMTDPTDAYGIGYFQVDPGVPGGITSITVTYYHAPTQTSGTPTYSVLETFKLTRQRNDLGPQPPRPLPPQKHPHAESHHPKH